MRSPDVDALIGVEIDLPDWTDAQLAELRMVSRFQVVQWTLFARPHSALMRRAIVEVVKRFIDRAKAARLQPTVSSLRTLEIHDTEILAISGPAMLTHVVQEQARADLRDPSYVLTALHGLHQPKLVGRSLMLPVT